MAYDKKYIIGFDILKFLMAFVIVSLHVGVSKVFSQPVSTICLNFQNLAVPVFFVLSSYLFFSKFFSSQEQDYKAIWRYERRLLVLYLIWSVIMIPITLFLHSYQSYGLLGILYWVKDFFFDYTFYASWFFGALLVGMPIVFLFRNHQWLLLALSLVLYIIFTFYAEMPSWVTTPFELYHQYLGAPSRCFLFGIIWIGIGCIASHNTLLKTVNDCISPKRACVVLLLVIVISIVFKPLQLFGVLSLIVLFFRKEEKGTSRSSWIFLRKCSIIIYCVHYVFIHLLWKLQIDNAWLVFIISATCSFLVSYIVVYLSNKKHFSFLKYLY